MCGLMMVAHHHPVSPTGTCDCFRHLQHNSLTDCSCSGGGGQEMSAAELHHSVASRPAASRNLEFFESTAAITERFVEVYSYETIGVYSTPINQ